MSDLFDSRELVAFGGSRTLSRGWLGLVGDLVSSVLASGRGVSTGDARGLDSLVSEVCPSAVVYSVAFRGRGAFASRSARMVGGASALVVFPSSACPVHCVPSRSFRGYGSGSWGSASLAVGLGLPLVVFRAGLFELPQWAGGSWVQVGHLSGVSSAWSRGFRWVAS